LRKAVVFRKLALVVFAVALLISVGGNVAAQQTVTSATLSGRVKDATDASVNGATIEAINLETNQHAVVGSDSDGKFRFAYLQVGAYKLAVSAPGFASLTKELTLTIGQAAYLEVRVQVAGMAAQVQVAADAPLIETVRTQVAETIRPAEINSLPLNGRNYLDLALLVPAVSSD
jgi:hypothetical protein